MLRYALRRVLWAIPTLFGISLVVFFLTTLIPDPAANARRPLGELQDDPVLRELLEERRARFLDLPRFFNASPRDVRARAADAVALVVQDEPMRARGDARLLRLGAAALPYVLPKLEQLSPEARGVAALALMPVAERMEAVSPGEVTTADAAVLFWARFWEDRALDFTGAAVDRSVTRLVDHPSDLRERDLRSLDTFALGAVIAAMRDTHDRDALVRLVGLASHATGRGPVLDPAATDAEARRTVAQWDEYWYVHASDFTPIDGADRVTATLAETRYGKWLLRAATGRLGISSRDGEPIADKLLARAPTTLVIALLAMLASYAFAVPLGAFGAWKRGRPVDTALAAVLFAMYSLPTFAVAEILHHAVGVGVHLGLAVAALAAASLATLTRYQRAATIEALGQDYVRTARAKGVSQARELVVHALRNALLPTVTLAGLQLPILFGGALVVEEIFSLPGLGYETVRAVEAHDLAWLMANILLAALLTTVGLIASDIAYGMLDPRVREALVTGRRAR
jgi:peptide/nickel transport system permease protein